MFRHKFYFAGKIRLKGPFFLLKAKTFPNLPFPGDCRQTDCHSNKPLPGYPTAAGQGPTVE
ncbi:hypothetical protein MTHERMOG20_09410 [Moorella thermoacetica]|nr:hypothetical protein MTHERMOG20_09410 [Moorella thermoacetica]